MHRGSVRKKGKGSNGIRGRRLQRGNSGRDEVRQAGTGNNELLVGILPEREGKFHYSLGRVGGGS